MTAVFVDPEASEPESSPPDDQASPSYGDPAPVGYLLDPETKPEEICRFLHDEWIEQRDRYARRILENEVNKRRRAGEGNLWVEKGDNQALYRIYEPYGSTKFSQFYQKANRLCLRSVAVLHPDPAQPEAVPTSGESVDRDAAEFTTRVLKDIGSESGLNDLEAHKQAFDWASNGGSAYVWYYTDPYGGGRQPIEVDAHPMAQHVDQAMVDPMTGGKYAGETKVKYVAPDGSLLDTKESAARRWVPKVAREVCEFGSVRLLPATATDIWDATGVLYAKYHTWGTLKGWFEGLAEVSDEDRDEATTFRLNECDHLLPRRGNKKHDPKPKQGHEDNALALLMIKWCVESPDYPEGAYIVTVGNKLVPHRGNWVLDGPEGPERRDLPFTQVMQWRGDADNPTGWGMMDFLGPSNEGRAEVLGQVLDMLDKALNPLTLVPIGSTLQPEDFDNPFATTIPFQPGFEPKRFEGPRLPPEVFKILDLMGQDMNDATGMGQSSAEGLEAPNVQSGRHALAIQSSQQASLADLNQNVNRAFQRGWRIQLQCIKADYDVPQLVRFIDKDGDYKAKRWLGSDLGSTRDVQIQRGTGTLFNPAQKAQFVAEYAQVAGIDPAEIQELLATGFSPYTQLQDNPHLLRVRRQIFQWEQGPPPGWQPPVPPPPNVVGVDPATGQPLLGPSLPPPPDPALMAIFDPRPVDMVPAAAQVRIREIGKAMAGTRYGELPPEWRVGLDMEFGRMQQALAPPPQMMPGQPPGAPDGKSSPASGPNGGSPLTKQEQAVLGPSVNQPAGAVAP